MAESDRTLVYFVSDLHLGAGYIPDPRVHEKSVVRWLRAIAPHARELYLLGDVLDYWYEYHDVVPRGFVRFFGALAELADSGVRVTWLKGNHDIWIYDYLPSELGVEVVDGALAREIYGKTFFMEHGDGCGETRPSYRRMRKLFRNHTAQKLFSAIHPRWTVPFAHRWSSHSRATGADGTLQLDCNHPLVRFAEEKLGQGDRIDYFVFGHLHVTVDRQLAGGARLIILGEGYRQMTFGVFDGKDFRLGSMGEMVNIL